MPTSREDNADQMVPSEVTGQIRIIYFGTITLELVPREQWHHLASDTHQDGT